MNQLIKLTLKSIVMFLISFAAITFFDSTATEATSDHELGDKLLGSGMTHSHVSELQELLEDRGYLTEEDEIDDGLFDVNTYEAVLSFQKETDIYIDGLAGPQTIGALMILKKGDEGNVVHSLQENLKHLGHYRSSLDGKFGPLTEKAVLDFQKDKKISVDGIAGPETYRALHDSTLSNQAHHSSSSTASSTEKPKEKKTKEAKPKEKSKKSDDESKDSEASSTTSQASESSSPPNGKVMTMEATAYTAYCKGCSGTTYTGIDLRSNPDRKVIAVDPNVIPLGSKVYVEGYGEAIAGDIGGAIKGHRVDLFIPNREDALRFGRRNVEVTLLE